MSLPICVDAYSGYRANERPLGFWLDATLDGDELEGVYLGSFLMGLGFAVMSGSWIAAALIVLPSFVIYPNVIRNEEAHLERLFPEEFRDYCTRVPRFFPRFRAVQDRFSLRQYLANREYQTALGFTAMLVVFIVKWQWIERWR